MTSITAKQWRANAEARAARASNEQLISLVEASYYRYQRNVMDWTSKEAIDNSYEQMKAYEEELLRRLGE